MENFIFVILASVYVGFIFVYLYGRPVFHCANKRWSNKWKKVEHVCCDSDIDRLANFSFRVCLCEKNCNRTCNARFKLGNVFEIDVFFDFFYIHWVIVIFFAFLSVELYNKDLFCVCRFWRFNFFIV